MRPSSPSRLDIQRSSVAVVVTDRYSGSMEDRAICVLFLGTPRDGIVNEIDNEGAGRGKIILVANLVNVRVGM